MNIGQAIKCIRDQSGMSQRKLAEHIGISANALCAIENGRSFPSQNTIRKLCDALNVKAGILMLYCVSEDDIPDSRECLWSVFESLRNEIIKTDKLI